MTNLEKVRQDYVKVYGESSPCCFLYQSFSPKIFLGAKKNDGGVCFNFTYLDNDAFHILEMQFRNRLSRKISFAVSDTFFSIRFDSFAEEELCEVKRAILDLVRFFSGRQMSSRLKAEISLHRKKLNWRDEKLVAREISSNPA